MSKNKKEKKTKKQIAAELSARAKANRVGQSMDAKVVKTKAKANLKPTQSKQKAGVSQQSAISLLYEKKHFVLILSGIGLIMLGMLLMAGGSMPSRDVWDESIIYSFRRITLAPISILAGLAVVLYAIFVPKNA